MARTTRSRTVLVAFLAGGACSHGASFAVAPGAPLVAVLAPTGGEGDSLGLLVNASVDDDGWYCSSARPPLRFEVMTADGEPRAIRAVGFVAANLGPDGVGPVSVRVQSGHGVTAPAREFRGEVHETHARLVVLELPEAVTGDHVVLGWLRGSAWRTAACLGELVVYDAAHGAPANAPHVALQPADDAPTLSATPDASYGPDVVDASDRGPRTH